MLMIAVAAWSVAGLPLVLQVTYVVGTTCGFALSGMYKPRLRNDSLRYVPATIAIVTVAVMAFVTGGLLFADFQATLVQTGRLWAQTLAMLVVGRIVAQPIRRVLFAQAARRKALIVGSGLSAVLVAQKIQSHPELGLETIGFVDDGPRTSVRGREEPLLGDLSQLAQVIEESGAEMVIFSYTHNSLAEQLLALTEAELRVEVLLMPRFFEFVSAGMRVDDLGGLPMLRVDRSELTPGERFVKRTEDLVLGGFVALLCLPFLPIIALLIKLDSPGPVFYKHERLGKDGKPFLMYKFRSMRKCADHELEALAKLAEEDPRGRKMKQDPRITKLGAFLRKSSIDEIPQIINVLKGEMSLVGPRPAVADEVAAYDDWQRKRLVMVPGITGMWQVNGRSDAPFDERIWLDFMYIDSWSLWLDLSILLQTVPAVLSAKGAY